MFNLMEIIEKEMSSSGIVCDDTNPLMSIPKNETETDTKLVRSPSISSGTFAVPLQASSPSLRGMEGEGDGHSVRSVCDLFSPIRATKASHQLLNITTEIETEPPSPSNADVELVDTFLKGFETESPLKKTIPQSSLPENLLLAEKIQRMNEAEVKTILGNVLVENMGLRQELHTREKRIAAYKGQMLAIMEWKVNQAMGDSGETETGPSSPANHVPETIPVEEKSSSGKDESSKNPQKAFHHKVQEIRVVNEVYGIRRSLSFIQELASSIEVDQELLKDRLKDGYYLTNQLLIGGFAGWLSALFVKKFGKIALSAAGGGMLLLVYTARRGYVNVNYDSIYQEISQICNNENKVMRQNEDGTFSDESDGDMSDWEGNTTTARQWLISDRIRYAKKWLTSHSYTVGGFVLSFMYNLA